MPIINAQIKGQGGVQPSGTITVQNNGTYDVTNYAVADVQVPSTAPTYYIEKAVDANGKLKNSGASIINFNGITDVSDNVLAYAYNGVTFPSNTAIDLSGITSISGQGAFQYAFASTYGITSVDLSGLTSVAQWNTFNYAFANCMNLTTVDLSSLTTIPAQQGCASMFSNCSNLTSVNLSSLTSITGFSCCNSMFYNCSNLTSIDLSGLTTATDSNAMSNMFSQCKKLADVDFSNFTTCNSMSNCFVSCNALKTISFPKLNVLTGELGSRFGAVFNTCYYLQSVSFGGLTASTFSSKVNQLQYLFQNGTGQYAQGGCTVHFPSNFDPTDPNHTFDASTLSGYPLFGGSASYIHLAFDLPATE